MSKIGKLLAAKKAKSDIKATVDSTTFVSQADGRGLQEEFSEAPGAMPAVEECWGADSDDEFGAAPVVVGGHLQLISEEEVNRGKVLRKTRQWGKPKEQEPKQESQPQEQTVKEEETAKKEEGPKEEVEGEKREEEQKKKEDEIVVLQPVRLRDARRPLRAKVVLETGDFPDLGAAVAQPAQTVALKASATPSTSAAQKKEKKPKGEKVAWASAEPSAVAASEAVGEEKIQEPSILREYMLRDIPFIQGAVYNADESRKKFTNRKKKITIRAEEELAVAG